MKNFEVLFYEKENGECPVEKFIISLDIKMRAKMIGLLELLEEKENIKKTQKTPTEEILLAERRRTDYIERLEKR